VSKQNNFGSESDSPETAQKKPPINSKFKEYDNKKTVSIQKKLINSESSDESSSPKREKKPISKSQNLPKKENPISKPKENSSELQLTDKQNKKVKKKRTSDSSKENTKKKGTRSKARKDKKNKYDFLSDSAQSSEETKVSDIAQSSEEKKVSESTESSPSEEKIYSLRSNKKVLKKYQDDERTFKSNKQQVQYRIPILVKKDGSTQLDYYNNIWKGKTNNNYI